MQSASKNVDGGKKRKTYPCLDAAVLSLMPQMPVGFAMMWVTETWIPSGSVDTPTLVITGGSDGVGFPFESVPVTNTGELKVLSGGIVTVCVEVGALTLPLPAGGDGACEGTWKGG
jgi:hypothetical protein